MRLSKVARAVNQLCLDLAPPPRGAEPPTPGGWFGFDECAEIDPEHWQLLEEQRQLVHEISGVFPPTVRYGDGFRRQEAERIAWLRDGPWTLKGWWCQIGSMPPVCLPLTVSLEDVQRDTQGFFVCRRLTYQQAAALLDW